MIFGQSLRVTLLGSGETFPQPGRLGPSILVEAGSNTYIFDVGRGILQRFGSQGPSGSARPEGQRGHR